MSLEQEMRALLMKVSEGWADALTEAATTVREEQHLIYNADQVAYLLTSIAADGMASAEKHFGVTS